MLAQSFKTADELGLREEGLQALIQVLGMMERGELNWTERNTPIKNGFNMSRLYERTECGTVACIAGWCCLISQDCDLYGITRASLNDEQRDAIHNLFCPQGYPTGLYTVEQAQHALRSFLVTGVPEWLETKNSNQL